MRNPIATRQGTQPVNAPTTGRVQEINAATSIAAGKCVPLAVIPLLREDGLPQGRFEFKFDMNESYDILRNAIRVDVKAYFVSNLALDRFDGMDQLNKSYSGLPFEDGGDVVDFIELVAFGASGANEIYKSMGLHAPADKLVNTAYTETYNQIYNFRAKETSPSIALRTRLQQDLGDAHFNFHPMQNLVPNFDEAKIAGEVALEITESKIPVSGLYKKTQNFSDPAPEGGYGPEGVHSTTNRSQVIDGIGDGKFFVEQDANNNPALFANFGTGNVSISLADLEAAKKTQAFAQLRARYSGHDDEHIIDLLMDGIHVPQQAFKQPILVGEGNTIYGMKKRYATDGASLRESVVDGETMIQMSVRVPQNSIGGVVMFIAEIVPERLYERQSDPYLYAQTVEDFPRYLRDEQDPRRVAVVPNSYLDTDHSDPEGVAAYAPLNHEWNIVAPRLGGRYYRPDVDIPQDENRQKFWTIDTVDPKLSEDWYMAKDIGQQPFVDLTIDPFEVMMRGQAVITGHTVFGGVLIEASDDYAKVLEAKPDKDEIIQPAP